MSAFVMGDNEDRTLAAIFFKAASDVGNSFEKGLASDLFVFCSNELEQIFTNSNPKPSTDDVLMTLSQFFTRPMESGQIFVCWLYRSSINSRGGQASNSLLSLLLRLYHANKASLRLGTRDNVASKN